MKSQTHFSIKKLKKIHKEVQSEIQELSKQLSERKIYLNNLTKEITLKENEK